MRGESEFKKGALMEADSAVDIGIAGWGTYLPERGETAQEIAERSGLPRDVLVEKMGLREKRVPGPQDHVSRMGLQAARQALARAGLLPDELDLVIYYGSEFKDYIVWSAAAWLQDALGAKRAWAFEVYALCAGTPVALHTAKALMLADSRLENVLLVTASREGDLIDYQNERTRFMFNFGAGAAAVVLRRDLPRNQVLESAFLTDGSFSEDVIVPAGGSRRPPGLETIRQNLHKLDVPNPQRMKERLDLVSLPNFLTVIREAVERSGHPLSDIGFLALTHMKRSFHREILEELGLREEQSFYLEGCGHVQAADQIIALERGLACGRVRDGDLIVLAGAGTGYTWAATALRWG